MSDYDALKELAKQLGCPVRDLLALAPANDPFSAGMGGRAEAAQWFAQLWQQYGQKGTHLRRLWYVLVSRPGTVLPDGSKFENLHRHWQYLGSASLAARYLGLIDPEDLVDNRNDPPLIFDQTVHDSRGDREGFSADVIGDEPMVVMPIIPEMPPLPWFDVTCEEPLQEFICEVWIEKSTQNDWLIRWCKARGVNLVVGAGELSEIRSRELAQRASRYAAPLRIFYLSDFDPGGRSMPQAVGRKVEYWVDRLNLKADIQIIPVALTPEQVVHYKLPPIPLKETEHRADTFERKFGLGGAVELDAMEALHPGELGRLLDAELDNYLDRSLQRRFDRLYSDVELTFSNVESEVHARYADRIGALRDRFEHAVARFYDLRADLQAWELEARDLYQTIASDLEDEKPDLNEVEVPQSEAPGDTWRFVLYSSSRNYLQQMQAYLTWRDGTEGGSIADEVGVD